MEKPIQIVYTNEAEERLEKLMNKLKFDIEYLIEKKRYIPGDKIIEITGSDIENVSKHFRMMSPYKIYMREKLINLYLIVGTTFILIGFFYNNIVNLLEENPFQLSLILLGAIMILAALWLKSLVNRMKYKYDLESEFK